MTKAEEALYHILCARWKVTNADATEEGLKRLFDQVESFAALLAQRIYSRQCNKGIGDGGNVLVVQ